MVWHVPLPVIALILLALAAVYLVARFISWRNRLGALADESAMFREMVNLVRDVSVTVHDLSDRGRVIYANDAACRHFGVSRATLLGLRPHDWNPHFDEARVDEFCRVLKSGDTRFFETEHRIASGEIVPVEVMLVFHESKRGRTSIAYTRDIRARKAEEARAMQSEREAAELIGLRRLSRFIGNTPGYFFTVVRRPDGAVSMPFVSQGIHDICGVFPADVENDLTTILAVLHPDDLPRLVAAVADTRRADEAAAALRPDRSPSSLHIEYRINHPEKGTLWVETSAQGHWEMDGSMQLHGFTHDITERVQLKEQLERREHSFRTLVENLPDPVFRYGRDCRRTYASPAAERVCGKSADELIGWSPIDAPLVTRYESEKVMRSIDLVLATGRPVVGELEFHAPDGQLLHFQNHFGPERTTEGSVVGVVSIMRDITELKRLEGLLRAREQEFRALVEKSPDSISRYDQNCRRVYVNPTGIMAKGGDATKILGTTPMEFPGWHDAAKYQAAIRDVLMQGKETSVELRWNVNGAVRCTHVRLCPEIDACGNVAHVLAIGRDITEIDHYRTRIHHQANSDALTNLPNRTLLSERIRQAIADGTRHGKQFGLMMLDLDHFKEINDTMGHGAGDALLSTVAKRLLTCVRHGDTVARLGGDEFSILLSNISNSNDLATIASKILKKMAEPFIVEEQELFITCSIGIALYPGDGGDADTLYKYADSAMYHAKQLGRNNFQFYVAEFTARSQERLEIAIALRKAQKNGEFELYYQPQIDLQTGRLAGAEALLRWRRPGYGIVGPDRFVPVAEASGLIVDIGEWVLQNACQSAARWNRRRAIPIRIAVNLSTRQFIRNDLAGALRRILDETGCDPAWLELEITESLLMEDTSDVAATLSALQCMGLSISIDDFGTGYSALSYLARCPVKQIKIDRSFVSEIPRQRHQCELVKAILSIGKALRLESVAEGVETVEQAEYLKALGCGMAQGYLFGRPMPQHDFEVIVGEASAGPSPALTASEGHADSGDAQLALR